MRQYKEIASKPYCCVPAVLEAILLRHGYKFDQVDIANYFGLTVPTDEMDSLSGTFTKLNASDEVSMIGIHLGKDGFNSFFADNGISLSETFVSASELSELNIESVLDAIPEDSDAVFFFDYGVLYGEERNKGVGHNGAFISREGEYVSYLDPGPRRLGINKVKIDDLLCAMKAAYAGGGISVISGYLASDSNGNNQCK